MMERSRFDHQGSPLEQILYQGTKAEIICLPPCLRQILNEILELDTAPDPRIMFPNGREAYGIIAFNPRNCCWNIIEKGQGFTWPGVAAISPIFSPTIRLKEKPYLLKRQPVYVHTHGYDNELTNPHDRIMERFFGLIYSAFIVVNKNGEVRLKITNSGEVFTGDLSRGEIRRSGK